ncbi:MAG: oligosaccharide flippase family protein [Caenispirillum sp.]|nr:oligosaccharide flippase family protein [Caenispirillum sp.]
MNTLRRIADTVFSLTAMRLVTALLSFLLFWLIARRAGQEVLGAYAVAMNLFLLLQQVPMLGLHLALIRDAAAEPQQLPQNRLAMTWIALPVSVLLCGGVFIYAEVQFPGLRLPLWLVALALVPTSLTGVTESILLGRERLRLVAVVNVAEAAVRTLFIILLVFAGFDLASWMAVFLCGRLLAMLAYVRAGQTVRATELWQGVPKVALRRYLKMCPTFAGILLASAILARLDVFMLSQMLPLGEVGTYAAAAKIFEVALMASSILVSALFPLFSATWQTRREAFADLAQRTLRWILLLGVGAATAVGFAAEVLMLWLFGDSYQEAAAVLVWMMPAALFLAGSQVFSATMLASSRQKMDLAALVVSASALLACLMLLVPAAGIRGAAWALSVAMAVQFVFRGAWFAAQWGAQAVLRAVVPAAAAGLGLLLAWVVLRPLGDGIAAMGGLGAYVLTLLSNENVRSEAKALFGAASPPLSGRNMQ